MSDLKSDTQYSRSRELVARAAHASWCAKMSQSGWHHGELFNEQMQIHDALVAYHKLGRQDKRALLISIEAEDFESRLADAVRYERGPAREFLLEDVRVGLRVGWNGDAFDEVEGINHDGLGVIIEWSTQEDDVELRSIEVRWDEGSTSTHHPCDRDLRRV